MHQIPQFSTGATLFLRDGRVRKFKSLREAYVALGGAWIDEFVRPHFCVYDGREVVYREDGVHTVPRYSYADAIMRDDSGKPLTASDFSDFYPKRVYRFRRFAFWNGDGPVPGTGGRRGGRYYRSLHTTNARRQAQCLDNDEPAPRAARNSRNIPTNWDDHRVTSRDDRNWKRFRRTQWKTPA